MKTTTKRKIATKIVSLLMIVMTVALFMAAMCLFCIDDTFSAEAEHEAEMSSLICFGAFFVSAAISRVLTEVFNVRLSSRDAR